MPWRKLGLVHQAPGNIWWARSHALLPTPLMIGADRLRIYFASTDKNTVGRIGFVEVAISDPTTVLAQAEQPVFDIGEPGSFDDSGVVPSSVLQVGEQVWLYYVGFQRGKSPPYTMFTGLAVSDDGGLSFQRKNSQPVFGPIKNESVSRTAAFVVSEEDGWRAWYVGGDSFIKTVDKQRPAYSIFTMESRDGIHWPGPSQSVLTPTGGDEYGFGRPRIIFSPGDNTMYYSIRTISGGYRLGVAKSADGENWTRRDDRAGIEPGPEKWDDQNLEYGSIFEHGDQLTMFYNGNQTGRTGFGAAASLKSEWLF